VKCRCVCVCVCALVNPLSPWMAVGSLITVGQAIMGMRTSHYMFSNFVLNFTYYCIVAAFFWIVGAALKFSLFSQTSPAYLFLFLFGWGLALVSMGMFIASFVSSRRVATVIGYIVALFGNLVCLVVADGIYGNIPPWSVAAP
jgi:hypothetical protein